MTPNPAAGVKLNAEILLRSIAQAGGVIYVRLLTDDDEVDEDEAESQDDEDSDSENELMRSPDLLMATVIEYLGLVLPWKFHLIRLKFKIYHLMKLILNNLTFYVMKHYQIIQNGTNRGAPEGHSVYLHQWKIPT